MIYAPLTRMAGAILDRTGWPGLGPRLAPASALPEARVWLHGASVGEIASAAPVIRAVARRVPVLVTANTATGRDTAAALGVRAAFAPLDTPQALGRFLEQVRPRVAVTVENELWPNRSAMLAERGIAQMVIGARLSQRSAARWGWAGGLIRPMLGRIAALSAQDRGSEARLVALGLPAQALLARVNLKLIGPAAAAVLPPGPERARTVLAASTHDGDEAILLRAIAALPQPPRLIIAPRHPQRFDAVAALMAAHGLAPARRSAGADAETAPVLLADTMGEMDRWYAAAGICLTGGSFSDHGGHTPWEPAAQSCAVLHGPRVGNFAADYARLDAADAARQIDAGGLGAALAGLLADPAAQAAMGAGARAVLDADAGDPAPLIGRIVAIARE